MAANGKQGRVRFGAFELDAAAGGLRRDGRAVKIQPQPLRVLALLVEHAGDVVSREALRQAIWDQATFVEFDQGLNYCIRQIRQVLGDDPAEPVYVRTLKKRGYEFIAPVDRLSSNSRPNGHAAEPSVAVLPFVDMSPDRDHEWFSDGIAAEIITALARTPGLKVISRTSAFAFKDERKDIRHVAEVLGVSAVLEGTVRTAGTRVRVTAQLINASDGSHLWSERYDRDLTDVFAVQDEIASSIATALKVRLTPRSIAPRGTANVAAYQAYLKARYHWSRATPDSYAMFKEFIDYAIELDPAFALAHSLLGAYYTGLVGLGARPANEVMPLARVSGEKALRLDPNLAEARALQAVVIGQYDFNWKEAERQWQLALTQTPISPDICFWYGNHYLLQIGRADEAVEAMTRGLKADPLNPLYRYLLALALCHIGRYNDAEAELRCALEREQNFARAIGTLAAVHAYQGRFEEALPLAERAYSLMPSNSEAIGRLAALVIRTGDQKRAALLIEKLRASESYDVPLGLAVFHAMCGELDAAAGWTAKLIEQRHPAIVRILGPLLSNSAHWAGLRRMMNLS
jgi:TolB-like protein/Tfp pilus assembly protein PilF